MLTYTLRSSIVLFVILVVITGGAYPLLVTGVAYLFFSDRALGSLVTHNGQVIGSELIGQQFSDPRYFQGRPSATSPKPYTVLNSAGSNLGPLNPAFIEARRGEVARLTAADSGRTRAIPVDLVTASGSGIDPHISIASARYQIPRIARARGMSEQDLTSLIERHAEGRQLGVLGEPRVNVLRLNLALDAAQSKAAGRE